MKEFKINERVLFQSPNTGNWNRGTIIHIMKDVIKIRCVRGPIFRIHVDSVKHR